MKYLLYFVFTLISLYPNSIKAQSRSIIKYSTIIDSIIGQKLLNQESRKVPSFISGYYSPTESDIQDMEKNFNKLKSLKVGNKQIKDINKYAYQYVGIIIDGKKYIYINAFSISLFDIFPLWVDTWENEPITMYDGGELYWGVVFDPQSGRFSQLAFNYSVKTF